jgi:hypothetical protein
MKKLLYSKKINNKSKEFIEMINIYCSKLNKEYAKNMLQLVFKIAQGENLNAQMLIDKYITNEETEIIEEKEPEEELEEPENTDEIHVVQEGTVKVNTDETDEKFLDKIIINGECYYYQSIENGIIYNKASKPVGVYKNKSFHIK